jgi:hypothetical protein
MVNLLDRFKKSLMHAGAIVSFGSQYVNELNEQHVEMLGSQTKIYATCPTNLIEKLIRKEF